MTLLGKLNHSGQRPVPQRAIGHQVRHTSLTYFSFVLLRKLLLFSPPYSEQSYTERGIISQGIWEMKKWKWMGSMSVKLRRGNRWRYQILGNFSLKRKKHSEPWTALFRIKVFDAVSSCFMWLSSVTLSHLKWKMQQLSQWVYLKSRGTYRN